jgi:hypothetical protein
LYTLGEGILRGVPFLLFEVGGLVPRHVLEGVPLLRHREMAIEQTGCGSSELLNEDMVLAWVDYETSHVLSFAGCTSPPEGMKLTRALVLSDCSSG